MSSMSPALFPYAVRLFGFPEQETTQIEQAFANPQRKGYGYFVLAEDNLQDPDLYMAKGSDPHALATLAAMHPNDLRPALLVGPPAVAVPYKRIASRIDRWALIAALDELVEKRADALARLEASDVVLVPERRRSRPDPALTDPALFERMRVRRPEDGIVLVVDKAPALRDYLTDLLARRRQRVEWAGDEAGAIEACRRQPAAMVLINTSTPGIDPYRVCAAVKEKGAAVNPAVVLLVSKPFAYDRQRAREVGVDGYLNKPLASHHLVSVLRKFVPKLYRPAGLFA